MSSGTTPRYERHTLSDEKDSTDVVLKVSGMDVGYGGVPVIHNVSLELTRGTIGCVVGPNGAGKSTLLMGITGDAIRSAGRVELGGVDITSCAPDELARRGLGWVPQLKDAFSALTVRENLEMGGYSIKKRAVAARVDEVVEFFPVLERLLGRMAGQLSGGERKILALGRALMARPSVLLLDEPTASLSPEMAHIVLGEYVRRLSDDGATVLMVEQRAIEALNVADWGYVMSGGRMRVSAPAQEILKRDDVAAIFLGE